MGEAAIDWDELLLNGLCDSDNGYNPFYRADDDTVALASELAEVVRAALEGTQEPRPDPLDVERLAMAIKAHRAFVRALDTTPGGWTDHHCGGTCSRAIAREYAAASPAAPETPR